MQKSNAGPAKIGPNHLKNVCNQVSKVAKTEEMVCRALGRKSVFVAFESLLCENSFFSLRSIEFAMFEFLLSGLPPSRVAYIHLH